MFCKTTFLSGHMKKCVRLISFFGKKQKVSPKENALFDIKSCIDNKPSCLKIADSCLLKDCCSLPRVIIVGAGLSGMSAAANLLKAGIQDLVILEATSRIGGRILSTWVGDAMIELGSTVLYGASVGNPVFSLANMADAVPYPVKRLVKRDPIFLTSDGRLITNFSLENILFRQLISSATSKRKVKSPCSSPTKSNLLQYLGLRVQQEVLHLPADKQADAERVLWGMINGLRASHGADLSLISSEALMERVHTPGGSIILPGGMHRILGPLLQVVPEGKMILNTPVYKILVEPNSTVRVIACDSRVFEADYVIVTVPIGVLKQKSQEMFDGLLSTEQINAINNIGVGLKNHVYLEYAHPWWIPGMTDMMLAWTMNELQTTNEWTKGITNIHEVPGSKHLLAVEMDGPEAELIEHVPEEDVAIQITRLLRKYTGDSSIPFPNNIIVTRWTCDPYFQGSTVYMGLNTTPGMFKDLGGGPCDSFGGLPLSPIIIAGDACIPSYFGTLEGARRSGIRAANKIITATQIKCEDERNPKENQSRDCDEEEELEAAKC